MSLLKKKTEKPTEREALSSPREIRDQIEAETKQKTQAIQKKHREKYLADWKKEKSKVDGMSAKELGSYLESSEGNAFDPRVGLHSMKINPHEHAAIKLAMEIVGARSSRELFVKYCKEVIANSK
ncbi:hypothetical protein [Vibrio sp. 10N.222.49.B4]|uniref:hypothetical protein n=1 Tax=Vibrio sp. 10N.222.49.B4 TaxID=3229613 RepID=UPI003551B469